MTTATGWVELAACSKADTEGFFADEGTATARRICGGCEVRPECLYDALARETKSTRYGIRGGLTAKERNRVPAITGPRTEALAELRHYLATQAAPTHHPEGTPKIVSDSATATPTADQPSAATAAEKLPIGKLLAWAETHAETALQDQAARARAAITGLRQRYAADLELQQITSEAQELEERLAALAARRAELAPAKAKKPRKPVGYPAAEVRAWAEANGHDCPAVGRVPKRVVDAWREATGGTA